MPYIGSDLSAEDDTKLIRYVGVNWFVFHVLQLLLIRFTQQNSCCIRKSSMKHLQKPDPKSDLPCFSCVDFLSRNIGPPDCVHC